MPEIEHADRVELLKSFGMPSLPTLYQFVEHKRDDEGHRFYDYDGEKAGEALAQVVGRAFIALNDMDSALFLSESYHFVEPHDFEVEDKYFESYVWQISCPDAIYRRFAAPVFVEEFNEKIRRLRLDI